MSIVNSSSKFYELLFHPCTQYSQHAQPMVPINQMIEIVSEGSTIEIKKKKKRIGCISFHPCQPEQKSSNSIVKSSFVRTYWCFSHTVRIWISLVGNKYIIHWKHERMWKALTKEKKNPNGKVCPLRKRIFYTNKRSISSFEVKIKRRMCWSQIEFDLKVFFFCRLWFLRCTKHSYTIKTNQ